MNNNFKRRILTIPSLFLLCASISVFANPTLDSSHSQDEEAPAQTKYEQNKNVEGNVKDLEAQVGTLVQRINKQEETIKKLEHQLANMPGGPAQTEIELSAGIGVSKVGPNALNFSGKAMIGGKLENVIVDVLQSDNPAIFPLCHDVAMKAATGDPYKIKVKGRLVREQNGFSLKNVSSCRAYR